MDYLFTNPFVGKAHTGYAFSEEERENRFKPGRGHDHPQN